MIGDAFCRAWCDRCHDMESDEIMLTATARHESYDMRNVRDELRSMGWRVDGDETICDVCVEEEEDDD